MKSEQKGEPMDNDANAGNRNSYIYDRSQPYYFEQKRGRGKKIV